VTSSPNLPDAPPASPLQLLFRGLPRHARTTVAIRIAAVGLEFLVLLALARILDAKAYGSYALAMSLVAIFAVPAAVGLDRLVVRELAACQATADWAHARGILRRALQVVLVASMVAAIALWIAGELILDPTGTDASRALWLAAALIPLVALARLRQGALQGLGHVAAGLAPEFLLQPAIVLGLAAGIALAGVAAPGAALGVGLQLVAAGCALVLGAWLLHRRLPPELHRAAPRYRDRAWWGAGIAFMWLVMMTTALTHLDTILVGRLVGAEQAGGYRVASQLAMLVGLPLTAISVAMAPVIAALHAAGRAEELRQRSLAAAWVAFTGALAVAGIILVGGRWILAAFGPGFEAGYGPALILSSAYLVHSAMATSGYLLIMSEHEKLVMVVFTAGAALNVAGGLILIPRLGATGAALSTGVSLCLVSIACALLARRKLGINGTIFARPQRRTASA
jgi:O-antigen/teichoic acid export membrane protein